MPHQFASINCKHCGTHYCPARKEVCPNCNKDGIAEEKHRKLVNQFQDGDRKRKLYALNLLEEATRLFHTQSDFSASLLQEELAIDNKTAKRLIEEVKAAISSDKTKRAEIDRNLVKHRYAAWCAGRAAAASPECRFEGEQCQRMIENVKDLHNFSRGWRVPLRITTFDELHRKMRKQIIAEATKLGITMKDGAEMSHGVAAKIINVYIKTLCIIPMLHMYERLSAHEKHFYLSMFHLPVDRILLEAVASEDARAGNKERARFFKDNLTWSKYDSDTYEEVISQLRKKAEEEGRQLWSIETLWRGHQ